MCECDVNEIDLVLNAGFVFCPLQLMMLLLRVKYHAIVAAEAVWDRTIGMMVIY